MQIKKTALFGGALMCAGIANAGVFEYTVGNYAYSATAFAFVEDDDRAFNTAVNVSASALLSNGYTSSVANAYLMSAFAETEATLDGFGIGGVDAYVNFAVNTDVLVTWDFDAQSSFVAIEDDFGPIEFSDSEALFRVEGIGDGSQVVTLLAGVTYRVRVEAAIDSDSENQTSTANIVVVPAPGAGALAGLSGFAAVRRSR